MMKIVAALTALLPLSVLLGCSSMTIESYQAIPATRDIVSRAPGSYSAGFVSGQTGVQSDQLLKSSLPCRLETFKMPSQQPVTMYIENALKSELVAGEKLSAPEGRRIDIVVNKLESDTSKIRNGRWTLDFVYKMGKISRLIQTTTEYPFDANTSIACRNTAAAFDGALRENFAKFFSSLR
jgi:hypothetical protein